VALRLAAGSLRERASERASEIEKCGLRHASGTATAQHLKNRKSKIKIKNPHTKSTHYNSATFAVVHGHMRVLRPVVNKVTVRQDRIWFGKVLIYECHYGGHFLLLVERLVGYPLFYACTQTQTDTYTYTYTCTDTDTDTDTDKHRQREIGRRGREGG
jgi:hypothetical protein